MGIFSKSPGEKLSLKTVRLLKEIEDAERQVLKWSNLQEECEKNPAKGDLKNCAAKIIEFTRRKEELERELLNIDEKVVEIERKRLESNAT